MKEYIITVNGTAYEVTVEEKKENGAAKPAAPVKAPAASSAPQKDAPKPSANGRVNVVAPMPGKIVSVKAAQGQAVKKGETVLILEAMKMENEIVSPEDGTVKSILVKEGESVEAGAVLLAID